MKLDDCPSCDLRQVRERKRAASVTQELCRLSEIADQAVRADRHDLPHTLRARVRAMRVLLDTIDDVLDK